MRLRLFGRKIETKFHLLSCTTYSHQCTSFLPACISTFTLFSLIFFLFYPIVFLLLPLLFRISLFTSSSSFSLSFFYFFSTVSSFYNSSSFPNSLLYTFSFPLLLNTFFFSSFTSFLLWICFRPEENFS